MRRECLFLAQMRSADRIELRLSLEESGKHLLAMSISHYDPLRRSALELRECCLIPLLTVSRVR